MYIKIIAACLFIYCAVERMIRKLFSRFKIHCNNQPDKYLMKRLNMQIHRKIYLLEASSVRLHVLQCTPHSENRHTSGIITLA